MLANKRLSQQSLRNGPLARYVKSWVAHAPGMQGTFSPPPTSKQTASYRSRHASRHVRHVPWCMSGWLTRGQGGGENVSGIPGACATHNFKYLARGPWNKQIYPCTNFSSSMLIKAIPLEISHINRRCLSEVSIVSPPDYCLVFVLPGISGWFSQPRPHNRALLFL